MAYQKKVWTDRQSEYPNRRGLQAVAGVDNVYEITREEGLVVEEGDPFDQSSMNALEGRVDSAFAELTSGAVKVGKAAGADSAARATTAATADNAVKAYGKTENTLSVSYAASAGSAGAVAWGSVSGKPATYPATGHTHDDRYFTEAETNSLLAGKANNSHNQSAWSITDGTLPVGVLATYSSDYGTSRLRNAYFATGRPSGLADGSICFVYE